MIRLITVSFVSAVAGCLAAVVMLLVTSQIFHGGDAVSAEDLFGIASFSFVPGIIMCGLLYAPVLLWLRQRRGGCQPRRLFLLVPAFVLNLPAFILLLVAVFRGTGFSGFTEISLFITAFVVTGLIFGAGFVRYCRMKRVSTT